MPGAKRPRDQLRLFPPSPAEPAPELSPSLRDRALAEALAAWFDRSARDLPWRRLRAPYTVLVSEIMLQQTRVDTVVPYFHRFLERFPDVRALADAPIDDVLHLWSGLGYYRRARQLHATAREVAARHGGVLPAEAEALRALPGIGAYTAGAIASIAYGRREPLVDGNVARVLARLEGVDEPVRSPSAVRRLWAIAARMLPDEQPGRFNEALMELGATVCTPRDPRCDACPVARFCVARAQGREQDLPVVEQKRAVPVVEAVAAVLLDAEGRILLARRREGGLFGGMWEPPMVEGVGDLSPPAAARRAFAAIGLGLGRSPLRAVGKVTHVLTHRRMEIAVRRGAPARSFEAPGEMAGPYEKAAWLDPDARGLGVSTLARKVIAAARLDEKD